EGLGEAYEEDIALASALEAFGGCHNDPVSLACFWRHCVEEIYDCFERDETYDREILRSQ
ncbi:hypothetical protein MKX03_021125, partial [Papaver bracteatum]